MFTQNWIFKINLAVFNVEPSIYYFDFYCYEISAYFSKLQSSFQLRQGISEDDRVGTFIWKDVFFLFTRKLTLSFFFQHETPFLEFDFFLNFERTRCFYSKSAGFWRKRSLSLIDFHLFIHLKNLRLRFFWLATWTGATWL